MGHFRIVRTLCVLAFALGHIDFTEARSNALMRHLLTKRDIPAACINNTVTKVSCDSAENTDSLMPHPDDCQLYYYCWNKDVPPICRQCPAGLHFHVQKHVCDYPERAGCQSNMTASDSSTSADSSTEAPVDSTSKASTTPQSASTEALDDIASTASTEYGSTTGSPVYTTTAYPYYSTTRYPYYSTTRYPYYSTTRYPYYSTTRYPYYSTTRYPYYSTTRYPYYRTTTASNRWWWS